MPRAGPLRRPLGSPAAIVLAALLLVLVGPSFGPPGAGTAPSAGTLTQGGSVLGSGCPGSVVGGVYGGRLVDLGGPSPAPSVVGQTVALTASIERLYTPSSGSPVLSCYASTFSATTNATGVFVARAAPPSGSCLGTVGCWSYRGPFGPVSFAVASASLPPGDYSSWTSLNGSVTIERVAAVDRAIVAPGTTVYTSTLAPTLLTASALDGLARPSPAALTFTWSVAGLGWTIVGPSTGASVTVEGASGAAAGAATVRVAGSYSGAAVAAASVVVNLTAIPTAISSAYDGPNELDAGEPVVFDLSGSGAADFTYSATIDPGLGLPGVPGRCSSGPQAPGLVTVVCSATLTYPSEGIAQPVGWLTNNHSTTSWSFAEVTVHPGAALSLSPAPAIAYSRTTTTFTGAVAAGSGTPPYGPACFAVDGGPTRCEPGAPGSWSFAASFPGPGLYEASLAVADATGSNFSVTDPVRVVDPPMLSELELGSSAILAGSNGSASAVESGGDYPIAYWWNESSVGTIASGALPTAGELRVGFTAPSPGEANLTLTCVDALGTRLARLVGFESLPSVARRLADLAPAVLAASAGAPSSLSFAAYDAQGERLPAFNGSATLWVGGAAEGTVWANATPGGALALAATGGFMVGPADWHHGYLNLTLSAVLSAELTVTLLVPGGLAPALPMRLEVLPDLLHLHLYDPSIGTAGPRRNATLYRIADRFGNPLASGEVEVVSEFGGVTTVVASPVLPSRFGGSLWVNFSAPGASGGRVEVLSDSGQLLLAPIDVPALPPFTLPTPLLAALAGTNAAIASAVVERLRVGRTRRRAALRAEGEASEAELRRLAEGRAHLLGRLERSPSLTVEELSDAWPGEPPTRAEIAEWLGALVREGAVVGRLGPDGRPLFTLASAGPAPPGAPPRIELDPEALERALARADRPEGDDRPRPPSA